jgi:glycosyltransferase involved in cell wall biosynthesis
MIVKNEEQYLDRCLRSIADLVDEIIIVDTGSLDQTKAIAKKYTDKVIDFNWIQDFSAARNYAFEQATKQYQMWLDADDYIKAEDQAILKRLKNSLSADVDVVMAKYAVSFDETGNCTMMYFRERLLKRSANFQWSGRVHEVITPAGKIEYTDFTVTHGKIDEDDPDRNLDIYKRMLNDGLLFTSRDTYYYARELYYHGNYQAAIKEIETYLNKHDGWVEDNISSCTILALCYYALGDSNNALQSYLRSFQFGKPRADICCSVAKHFFDRSEWNTAIFWYKSALTLAKGERDGFIYEDSHGFVPFIQLCVCYDRLGDRQKAEIYNTLAGRCKPSHSSFLDNKAYFDRLKQETTGCDHR